mmetsp:Transcript_87319/g.242181  ORF Transcript_87319/g.242181 Transcript_87319/m.242181 type:complete len:562 (-) Transcript_87319:138-1823(-)
MLDDALHGVVTKLVVHQLVKRRLGVLSIAEYRTHEVCTVLPQELGMLANGRDLEALLDDVAGDLVLREVHHVPTNHFNDVPFVLLSAMLQNALYHVVAVLVPRKLVNPAQDPLQQALQRVRGTTLEQSLDDPASVHVRCHLLRAAADRRNDEANRLGRYVLNALLDHVVAVHALYAANHILSELRGNHLLRLPRSMLDRLLDDAAPLRLIGQSQHVLLQPQRQLPPLIRGPDIKELLDHKAAECIAGEHRCLGHNDIENRLLLVRICLVQLCLKKAATMMILSKLQQVREDLSHRHATPATLPSDLRESKAPVGVRVIVRGCRRRRNSLASTLLLLAPAASLAALGLAGGSLLAHVLGRVGIRALRRHRRLRRHTHSGEHAWRHHRHARVHGRHAVWVRIPHPGCHGRRICVHAVGHRRRRVHATVRGRVPITWLLRRQLWLLRWYHLRLLKLRLLVLFLLLSPLLRLLLLLLLLLLRLWLPGLPLLLLCLRRPRSRRRTAVRGARLGRVWLRRGEAPEVDLHGHALAGMAELWTALRQPGGCRGVGCSSSSRGSCSRGAG